MLTQCLRKAFLINALFPFIFQKLKLTENLNIQSFLGYCNSCMLYTNDAGSIKSWYVFSCRVGLAFIAKNGMSWNESREWGRTVAQRRKHRHSSSCCNVFKHVVGLLDHQICTVSQVPVWRRICCKFFAADFCPGPLGWDRHWLQPTDVLLWVCSLNPAGGEWRNRIVRKEEYRQWRVELCSVSSLHIPDTS